MNLTTVVGDHINTIKTIFYLSFNYYQAFFRNISFRVIKEKLFLIDSFSWHI